MLKSRTVFIVGAGAGVDYQLPVGAQLARTISEKLNIKFDWDRITHGDTNIAHQLRRKFPEEFNLYQEAAWSIRDGISLVNSIDDFLDINQEDTYINRCGKVAIVKSILESERNSRLFFSAQDRETLDISSLSNTWLVKFFKLLIRSSKAETAFDNVAFVNFNYDRCLEHFFTNALKALYRLSQEEADKISRNIKIYHPYGTLGYSTGSSPLEGIPFGNTNVDLIEVSKGIKTYTEKLEEHETDVIRELIRSADTLIFLGFAFHEQNMALITPQQGCAANRVLATAYGISFDDTHIVRDFIAKMFREGRQRLITGDVNSILKIRNDLDCTNFLDQFSLTIAN